MSATRRLRPCGPAAKPGRLFPTLSASLLLACHGLLPNVRASSFSWNGASAGSANWSDSANWDSGAAPSPATDSDLLFAAQLRNGDSTCDYTARAAFRQITFAAALTNDMRVNNPSGSGLDLYGALLNQANLKTVFFNIDLSLHDRPALIKAEGGPIDLGNGALLVATEGGTLRFEGAADNSARTIYVGGAIRNGPGVTAAHVTVDAVSLTVRYRNPGNDYSGRTSIVQGELACDDHEVVPDVSELDLADAGSFDKGPWSETVASLTGNGTVRLGTAGGGSLTCAGDQTGEFSGTFQGGNPVVKKGSGTWTLSGNSDGFTGDLQVAGGTLCLGRSGAAGAGGAIHVGGIGASPDAATLAVATGVRLARPVVMGGAGTGLRTLAACGGAGTATLAGGITLNTNAVLAAEAGATLEIATPGIEGAAGLVKSGNGTLKLAAANAYSGATTIRAGVLQLTADGQLGAVPAAAAPAHLVMDGGTLYSHDASFTLHANRGVLLGPAGGVIQVYSGRTLILGGAAAGAGSLTKTGAGTLELSGSNSYTGGTTILSGAVRITSDGNLGATPAAPTPGHLVLNGGTLYSYFADVALHANRGIRLGPAGGAIQVFNGRTCRIAGILADSGTLQKTGAGTLALDGLNTYTNATRIEEGAIRITADHNLGAAPASACAHHLVLQNGTLATGDADVTLHPNRGILLTGGGGTLDVAAGRTLRYGGVIAGTAGLSKTGAGTLALSGSPADGHALTVSAGTLLHSGAGTDCACTVAAGATLAGEGALGLTTNHGTLAPGNTAGATKTLTVAGLILAPGGRYAWQAGAVAGVAGEDWDLVRVGNSGGGAAALTATGGSPFTIVLDGSAKSGFDAATSYAWKILEAGVLSGLDAATCVIDASAWGSDTAGGRFTLREAAGDLFLDFTAEPATHSSGLRFAEVTNTSMAVSWTEGNGENRLVVMRQGAAVSAVPVDGLGYAADAGFGRGAALDAIQYVVYAGAGHGLTVTNLLPGREYHVAVFEYNGADAAANYFTSGAPLRGAQATATYAPVIDQGPAIDVSLSENGRLVPPGIPLSATDPDPGDALTWSIAGAAFYGTATAGGTGASPAVGYAPPPYFAGADRFAVRVTDSFGNSDSISVQVTVQALNATGKAVFIFE